jgi:hypothetical protein
MSILDKKLFLANLADGVNKGYVKYDQLHRVLVEEQGLEW